MAKILLDVNGSLRDNFKSTTARYGKDMTEAFRTFMDSFNNNPEKYIQEFGWVAVNNGIGG